MVVSGCAGATAGRRCDHQINALSVEDCFSTRRRSRPRQQLGPAWFKIIYNILSCRNRVYPHFEKNFRIPLKAIRPPSTPVPIPGSANAAAATTDRPSAIARMNWMPQKGLITPFSAFTDDPSRKTGDPPKRRNMVSEWCQNGVKMRQSHSVLSILIR